MTSSIETAIYQAKTFLREYAIATGTAKKSEISSISALYLALPEGTRSHSDHDRQLWCVVRYCTSILESLKSGLGSQKTEVKYEFGSVDGKAIGFLIEVVVHAITRPVLSTGFGPTTRDVLGNLKSPPPASTADMESEYRFVTSLIREHSEIFAALYRPEMLALLIAGAVELVYHPDTERLHESVYRELINSIAPSKLLPSIQSLLTKTCPKWARNILTKEMTNVLLQPKGLSVTSAFILRPDLKGEVPLERFDTLAALVAAKPSTLTESEYMNTLAPQIFELLQDKSSLAQQQHRAAAVILRQLCTRYDSAKIIIDKLWAPLLGHLSNDLAATTAETLSLLSDFTAFDYLRKPVLIDHVSHIMRLGYHFHHTQNFGFRDQIERLLYRLTENHDRVDLLPGCDNVLLTDVVDSRVSLQVLPLEVNDQHNRSHNVQYVLRLAEQIAANGQILQSMQWNLISSYTTGVEIVLRTSYLDLMMELPTQNRKCFFGTIDGALLWIDRADTFFESSIGTEEFGSVMTELSIVHLNMLRLLMEEVPHFSPEHVEKLEKLILALKNYTNSQSQVNTVAMAVQQKLEITVLSIRSSNQDKLATYSSKQSEDKVAQRYAAAVKDMSDDMVPNRAHGLYMIGELAKSGAELEVMQMNRLLPVMMGLLGDEEAFVHHNAIKALRKLHDAYGEPFREMLIKYRQDKSYSLATRNRIDAALLPVETS